MTWCKYRRYAFVMSVMVLWLGIVLSSTALGDVRKVKKKRRLDPRNITQGVTIYEHGYCDQPYVVITKEGDWLCTFTTGADREGKPGQFIVASLSKDKGNTWSEPVPIEPAGGPEASWVMPLITPSGRVYAFYDYNGDNIRTLPNGKDARVDMLGWYCYKYSDDNGQTWSERYRLPVRVTACDRGNDWQGQVQIMWGIGEPVIYDNTVYFGFSKLGRYLLDDGEGWFFRSDNILTEPDASKINWQMLPDGDQGLRNPDYGSVQEEHNLVPLSNGDLFCIYRTTMGFPAQSYSRDGAHTWSTPEPASYTPGGRTIRHPRACPRLWKCKNGKYLFWFHNHAGDWFEQRNPAWLSGGVEKDGFIYWSQPEIVLYDDDIYVRMSYPDLVEQDGKYWITETQKTIARVHEIDPQLIQGLWDQHENKKDITQKGLKLSLKDEQLKNNSQIDMPPLPNLSAGDGFSIELLVNLTDFTPGQTLLDSRNTNGKGIRITTSENNTLRLEMNDGEYVSSWNCDPDMFKVNQLHHIIFTVDGGSAVITCLVDGILCDGQGQRQFGWGRFCPELYDVTGGEKLSIAPDLKGQIKQLRIYSRYLRTSEAVSNYRSVKEEFSF